jgi:negative regulator of flagellin synthesis FlgM
LQDEIMEITNQLSPSYALPSDAPAPAKLDAPKPTKADASPVAKPTEARLDVLQDAMRSLADVDMDKVAAAKQALLRGDIDTGDTASLASSILSYHRGSDV